MACCKEVVPLTALIAAECATVGLNTFFKAAAAKGMSYYVFMVYTYAIAALLLLPFVFIFPSKSKLPSDKRPLLFRIILLGVNGLLSQICGYNGLEFTSPTLASAISNLIPAFTFILAVCLRMEKAAWKTPTTQAKIIGTVVSISGALVVVLCKGPALILSTPSLQSNPLENYHLSSSQGSWVIGGLLFAAQNLLLSMWYIGQTQVMKIYPAEILMAFSYYLSTTILAVPVCFLAESNLSAWTLNTDKAVVAVVYSGFIGQAFVTVIHTWALHLKGPVYISIFKPLQIAIAAAMGVLLLGDTLYLGSVLGATIISVGFYAIIWGKAKEEECNLDGLASSSSNSTPFLQSLRFQKM